MEKRVIKQLPVKLTRDEWEVRAREVARLSDQIADADLDVQREKEQGKLRVKDAEAVLEGHRSKQRQLSRVMIEGVEPREVSCIVTIDRARRLRTITREDTKEIVDSQPLTDSEVREGATWRPDLVRNVSELRHADDPGLGRLPAWVKGGRLFLNPVSIDAWQVGTRGPPPPVPRPSGTAVGGPLEVRMGNANGKSFRVKYPGNLEGETRIDHHVIGGRIPTWRRVAVITGGEGKHRLQILEPADEDNELVFAGFSVRGRFRVVEKVNNAREAREMFTAFRAA
jgi:hypothetical protein